MVTPGLDRPSPSEAVRCLMGYPAIRHIRTSAPSPQDRHKTAPHHIAHCYIHLRITVDAQGSSCGSKRGKKKATCLFAPQVPRVPSLPEARGGDLRRPSCNNRTQHADPSTPVRARHGPIPLGPSTPVYIRSSARPSTRPSVCLSARCFPALV